MQTGSNSKKLFDGRRSSFSGLITAGVDPHMINYLRPKSPVTYTDLLYPQNSQNRLIFLKSIHVFSLIVF